MIELFLNSVDHNKKQNAAYPNYKKCSGRSFPNLRRHAQTLL